MCGEIFEETMEELEIQCPKCGWVPEEFEEEDLPDEAA